MDAVALVVSAAMALKAAARCTKACALSWCSAMIDMKSETQTSMKHAETMTSRSYRGSTLAQWVASSHLTRVPVEYTIVKQGQPKRCLATRILQFAMVALLLESHHYHHLMLALHFIALFMYVVTLHCRWDCDEGSEKFQNWEHCISEIPFDVWPDVDDTKRVAVTVCQRGSFIAMEKNCPIPSSPPLRSMRVTTRCMSSRIPVISVPNEGKGDCLWLSAQQLLAIPWQQIKTSALGRLRRHAAKSGALWLRPCIRQMQRKQAWADTYAVQAIAETYGVPIYLHSLHGDWCFCPLRTRKKPIHIHHADGHFTAAFPLRRRRTSTSPLACQVGDTTSLPLRSGGEASTSSYINDFGGTNLLLDPDITADDRIASTSNEYANSVQYVTLPKDAHMSESVFVSTLVSEPLMLIGGGHEETKEDMAVTLPGATSTNYLSASVTSAATTTTTLSSSRVEAEQAQSPLVHPEHCGPLLSEPSQVERSGALIIDIGRYDLHDPASELMSLWNNEGSASPESRTGEHSGLRERADLGATH